MRPGGLYHGRGGSSRHAKKRHRQVLTTEPFSTVAATACFVDEGRFTWEDERADAGGAELAHFGDMMPPGMKDRRPFEMADPSTWRECRLR